MVLPFLALVTRGRLSVIDDAAHIPLDQIAAIRTVPFLTLLPLQMIEYLAGQMSRIELTSGSALFSRGDHGDSFYILDQGTLEIDLPEGVKRETAPAFVGEIALLHDIPRTATVRAGGDAVLWRLDRDAFLAAVGGHARARGHADSIVFARLDAANANAL